MDPVGKQGNIKSDEYRVSFQKTLDNGGTNKGRQFNHESYTRDGEFQTTWQGKTKGATKHKKQ